MQAQDVLFFMPFIDQITYCIFASPQLPISSNVSGYISFMSALPIIYTPIEATIRKEYIQPLLPECASVSNIITKAVVLPLCANEQVNLGALHLHVRARKAYDP
jgi:hypothetical protein